MSVVSTGTVAELTVMISNNKMFWKDYLRHAIRNYDNILIHNGFILNQIKRNEGFNSIIVIVVKKICVPFIR